MACEVDKKRNCFTFIWKVENADCWWQPFGFVESPKFTVKEIDETNWNLKLHFFPNHRYFDSLLLLCKLADKTDTETVELDCELAFLSPDGAVLHSFERKNLKIKSNEDVGFGKFPSRYDVFFARRAEFLSQDTLTVRCRMWKSVGEISKKSQCLARTRISVEKRSFLWYIQHFLSLKPNSKQLYQVESLSNGELLLSLEFYMTNKVPETSSENQLRLKTGSLSKKFKLCNLELSILDASKNKVRCLSRELLSHESKELTLFYTKTELETNKSAFLPNNVLSLLCECSFSTGNLTQEIEETSSKCPIEIPDDYKADKTPAPKVTLANDFKSMLENSEFSDLKLKTKSKTYPAHKLILSVRSPVFKAMFSNNMKENIKDCVDIDDLSDQTVLDILRYIYSAEVKELEWGRAIQLYEAADKYQILDLKDLCASFLKTNLCPSNACVALVLADIHQDDDLKSFVQDFILGQGEDIVNSQEWDQMMEGHVKLAAETMRLKFKKMTQ